MGLGHDTGADSWRKLRDMDDIYQTDGVYWPGQRAARADLSRGKVCMNQLAPPV